MSGDTIPTAASPLAAKMASGEQCVKGKLYKDNGSALLTIGTAKADEVVCVGAKDSVDAEGTAVTGGDCEVYNEGTVPVQTKAGTYKPFGLVYLSDDVDGLATPTDPGTGTILGRAIVKVSTVYTQGQTVPTKLSIDGKNVTS